MVKLINVECGRDGYDPRLWVSNTHTMDGCSIVEGPLSGMVAYDSDRDRYEGCVYVVVESDQVAVISELNCPWGLRLATGDDCDLARSAAEHREHLSRSEFRRSKDFEGKFRSSDGELVYSVKLTDVCEHDETNYDVKGCGHAWCRLCDGWVHPGTKVALKGAGPIITCNRKRRDEYEFYFREGCSGSEVLTRTMRHVFGSDKVEEGLVIRKGLHYDLRNKKVYETEKKRVKSRSTFFDHWSPPCTTNTKANRGRIRRWKDEPYGRCQDADLMQDSVVQVRVENLCEMKHLVGDFFAVEHIWPTTMVQMDCFQRLLLSLIHI